MEFSSALTAGLQMIRWCLRDGRGSLYINNIIRCLSPVQSCYDWNHSLKHPITKRSNTKTTLSSQCNDFRRDLLRQTSQIRLKLSSMANAPHSLCTCGSQIMQFDCMIIQSADSMSAVIQFDCVAWEDWVLINLKQRVGRVQRVFDPLSRLVCVLWIYKISHQKSGFSSLPAVY